MKEPTALAMANWITRTPTTDNTNATYIFRADRSKPEFYIHGPAHEAKARRITACLNSCRGLSTDDMEKSGLATAFGNQLIEQDKQIERLLAALDEIASVKPRLMTDESQCEVLVYARRTNPAEIARNAIQNHKDNRQ